jgi:hypothetical protein
MSRVEVVMLDRIINTAVSADGLHMLLRLGTSEGLEGSEISLALACDHIASLIDHCACASAESERIQRLGRELKLTTTWWCSTLDRETGELMLALTFGKGGTLSFCLSEHMACSLLATLRSYFEPHPAIQTTKHAVSDEVAQPSSLGFS